MKFHLSGITSFIFCIMVVIKSFSLSADSDEPNCDLPWEKLHNTCVRFMKSKPFLSWQEARDSCISLNSDLLSIVNKEENGKIVPLLKKHVKSFDLIKWWVGMRQVETSWRWLDGDKKYAKIPEWAPNSGHIVNTQKRCGLLDFKGYLSDVDCDTQTKPYICKQFKVDSEKIEKIEVISIEVVEDTKGEVQCFETNVGPPLKAKLYINNKEEKNTSRKIEDKPRNRYTITTSTTKLFTRFLNQVKVLCCSTVDNNTCGETNVNVLFPPKHIRVEENSKENQDNGDTIVQLKYLVAESNPNSSIVMRGVENIQRTMINKEYKQDKGTRGWTLSEIWSFNFKSDDNQREITFEVVTDKFPDHTLRYIYKPNITYYPIITILGQNTVQFGDDVILACQVKSNPPSKLSWYNRTNLIQEKYGVETLNLYLPSISTNHSKTYTCRANNGIGGVKSKNFTLIVKVRTCPIDTDYMNISWDTGRAGKLSFRRCPNGYNGQVSRYCNGSGVYQDPIFNCTKSSIDKIHRKLIDDKNKGSVESEDIIDALDKLTNATSESDEETTLLIGDIDTTLDSLSIITDVITVNTTRLENITNSYIATVNNILDESTTHTWTVTINQTGSGADIVLKNTDSFVEKILTTAKNVTAEISKPNLYLKLESIKSCTEPLNFPERETAGVSEWILLRQDKLNIKCDSSVESFSGIMYRNISKIIPVTSYNTKLEGLQLNAPVISFTLYPNNKRQLVSPVEITFQLYRNTWDNARCSFLKESHGNSSLGYWSDEGCRHKKDDKNKDFVVCVCDHLTNFAVLMNPSSTPIGEDHLKALSVISLIGCIISIVFLVLTVAIHAYFWRFINSIRSIIHINLSCGLILAYILFLAGINRTENKDFCKAIAILLHLAFLVVIFGMMTEGCNLSYTVLKPLSTKKPGIPLLIASYVLAEIIVVISIGTSQLEGYGTEKTCWLSTETGLIWAFLIPVFVVILINVIIVALVIRTMCNTTTMSKKSSKGRAKYNIVTSCYSL